MANYFSKFPKLFHSFNDSYKSVLVTNLLARVNMSDSVINNVLLYYNYNIQEGDTPEIVAEKYYGDAEKHWIILVTNKIFDPFYEWPLSYQNFIKFIDDKYGSRANAYSQIHHYEKVVETIDSINGVPNRKVYIIDETYYNGMQAEPLVETRSFTNGRTVTVTTSRNVVNSYDYEENLNNSRYTIKLLNEKFVGQVENEFLSLMRNV